MNRFDKSAANGRSDNSLIDVTNEIGRYSCDALCPPIQDCSGWNYAECSEEWVPGCYQTCYDVQQCCFKRIDTPHGGRYNLECGNCGFHFK